MYVPGLLMAQRSEKKKKEVVHKLFRIVFCTKLGFSEGHLPSFYDIGDDQTQPK